MLQPVTDFPNHGLRGGQLSTPPVHPTTVDGFRALNAPQPHQKTINAIGKHQPTTSTHGRSP